MKEKKIKKQEVKQNAKLEDKQLDQVQGGMSYLLRGSMVVKNNMSERGMREMRQL